MAGWHRRVLAALVGLALLLGLGAEIPPAFAHAAPSASAAQFSHSSRSTGRAAPRVPASANLVYQGGPVQRSSVAYLIFWGATWSNGGSLSADAQIARTYFADVGGTSYANILTQYSDTTGPIANTLTLGGVYLDTTHAVPTDTSCGAATLQDSAIQAEVSAAIAAQGWPTDSANGLYAVFTPSTVAVNDGSGACSEQSYCTYHNWSSSANLAYAVIAYPTDLMGCGASAAPNGNIQGDSLANLAAYVQFETITDPRVTTGWLDSSSLGVAGKCGWNTSLGTVALSGGGNFAIQPMYSNASSACVKKYAPGTIRADTIGVYRSWNSTFYLRKSNTPGNADLAVVYGIPGDIPLVGDWTGKGYDSIGVYRPSNATFYLRNSNTSGSADIAFVYGIPGDIPLVGDWTGKGYDSIGVYRPSAATFYLRNSNTSGSADTTFIYGNPGDRPVVGDWTGKGYDTAGVVRGSYWYLRNSNSTGGGDIGFQYAVPGDTPIMGDWTAKGYDSAGVYRSSAYTFYLRNGNTTGVADLSLTYGIPGDIPLSGVWS